MDMVASEFNAIPTCDVPDQTGCLCTWMTYGEGFLPDWLIRKKAKPDAEPLLIVHPVTWTKIRAHQCIGIASWGGASVVSIVQARRHSNLDHRRERVVDGCAEIVGRRMFQRDNWHSGDINLFWHNIYVNVQERTQKWHDEVDSNSER